MATLTWKDMTYVATTKVLCEVDILDILAVSLLQPATRCEVTERCPNERVAGELNTYISRGVIHSRYGISVNYHPAWHL